MSVYDSEEEQVEALKKWWNENGKSIVGGAVLGLGAVFGWQTWEQHQDSVAEEASFKYGQLVQASGSGNTESAGKLAEILLTEHGGSSYAMFAAFELAKIKLEQGEYDVAKAQLEWVLANGSDHSMVQLARLRLARLLLDQDDVDGAKAIVVTAEKDGFAGEFAALRGDIAHAGKEYDVARKAYKDALAGNVGNRQLIQMKLDDMVVTTLKP